MKFFITLIIFLITLIFNISYTTQNQYYSRTNSWKINFYRKPKCRNDNNEKVLVKLTYNSNDLHSETVKCVKANDININSRLIFQAPTVSNLNDLKDVNITFTYKNDNTKVVKNIEKDCRNNENEEKKYKILSNTTKIIECRFSDI